PSTSPNVRYCLPNKLFEYLMAGLPVLASPLDAVRDILLRYEAGAIVESLEPERVGHAIGHLLRNPARLASMRQNALRASAMHLNWEREQAELIQLYARTLDASSPQSHRVSAGGAAEAVHQTGASSEESSMSVLHD